MSIIEISFHLIKCTPNINYSDYIYTIYSNQTDFNQNITYNAHNSITDIIDYKTDLQYYVKVYNSKDLIGVSNFLIQSKSLYKKTRKQLLDLQLTLSEKTKRFLKQEGFESVMSVKLLITFNYTEKKIGFRKHRGNLEKVFSKPELRDIPTSPVADKSSQKRLFEELSSTFKTPFDILKENKKLINKSSSVTSIHNQNKTNNTNINSEYQEKFAEDKIKVIKEKEKEKEEDIQLSHDNSLIDSLIGIDDLNYSSASENEEKKTAIKELKQLKKQLSYDSSSENKKPFTNKELKDQVIQLSTRFFIAHKALADKLTGVLEENNQLINCYNKYNEKFRNTIKKEHKAKQSNEIHVMRKEMTSLINKKTNDIRAKGINAKRLEYEMAYELLKDLGVRRREDDKNEKELTEKEFFIEIFKVLIDMKANIADAIDLIKKDNLIYLCEKYDIPFKDNVNNCITKDIKEEDEDEDDEANAGEEVINIK